MRFLVRLLAGTFLLFALAFLVLVATTPGSVSGFGYALTLLLFAGSAVWEGQRRRLLHTSGLLLVLALGLRVLLASEGRTLRMGTPASLSSRWLDRVIDEKDLSVNAARALALTGFLRDPDVPLLADVMRDAYDRMHAAEGATPSPVLATYAGLEETGKDDTIEMGDVATSDGVLVFLHGYAGSFTLPCWVASRAAHDAGFATVCPSTRWVGDWWTPEGEATLRETIRSLRRRGSRRIVLAGLSNGGVGASLLAPRLVGTSDAIQGLVVISGASPEAIAPGVPVLAIQGAHDSQVPAFIVRAYAGRVGGRYVSLDAGHFAMLVREKEAMGALTSFLRARSGVSGRAVLHSMREPRP
jgi:hypothetical protein